jgi:1,3-beta-galactosyl-N-acetylhexosamine phosphorylase
MCWTAGKDINKAYSTNEATDCNYYPASGKYAIVNNSRETQTTTFYDIDGKASEYTLAPMEILWIEK